jgi:Flp pilus assembly protein TadG
MTRPRRLDRSDDVGMVTAELAASLPVLMVVLAVVLGAVSMAGARVRAQDAASMAARAAARGDAASANRLFTQLAPSGARLEISTGSDEVTATVREDIRPLGGWLGSYSVVERAVAATEPDLNGSRP